MCGIACVIDKKNALKTATLEAFTRAVRHRGPDGEGFAYFDHELTTPRDPNNYYVGLGHRRLSILDLSPAGAQPMFSDDGDRVIAYNGEIYNYVELREELRNRGYRFRSNCDTEVLLAATGEWKENCLGKLNGMWSFAALSRTARRLLVSRDRLGVKPLYYYQDDEVLAFASEIKQFFALPSFRREVNPETCVSYLLTGYERPPETFFKGVYAFPPGHYAEIALSGADNLEVRPTRFWFPENIEPRPRPAAELIEQIGQRFGDAVRFRLRSDVPVGGCLSGGLDSSAIFTRMKALAPNRSFAAFSSCFRDPSIDETPFMEEVIRKTGSEHFKVYPTNKDFTADFDKLLLAHDEPFGSASVYAQYRVMRQASETRVPVLLDGQGGDELFSGYWASYFLTLDYHLRRGDPFFALKHALGALSPWGNRGLISQAFDQRKEYRRRAERRLPFVICPEYVTFAAELTWHRDARKLSPAEYRRAEILKIHLPRLLKWEDRDSMAFSIESRVPFLDVNLVELVLSIPPEMNLRSGWNKYLFRQSEQKYLPPKICWRKDKKGFETPQNDWSRSGPFNARLLAWAAERELPIEQFVGDSMGNVREALLSGNFDALSIFRVFCLDRWLALVVGKA